MTDPMSDASSKKQHSDARALAELYRHLQFPVGQGVRDTIA